MHAKSKDSIVFFFGDNPFQLKLFKIIRQYIDSIGVSSMKVTKTQISFANKRQFAWIWIPLANSKKRPPNSIVLSFSLENQITHPKIVEVVEPYRGRNMHHVIIGKADDFNEKVKSWLSEAYKFAGSK